jgi:type I restriction enzyme, S subunit
MKDWCRRMNEDIINEVPIGWVVTKLGKYAITQKGKKPKNVSKVKTDKYNIPYVNIKAFEKNEIDEYTDGENCVFCDEGDFLMVWDGSRSGYVGKAIKGAVGSTLVKLNFPGILNEYAYYFLQSKYIKINTRAKGTGTPHVDPSLLWNYDFPIPPINEQQRIVNKISELFSEMEKGVENLKVLQRQLEVYRQAILKSAFEGKFTEKWRLDNENLEKLESLINEIDLEIETNNNVKQKKNKLLKKLTTDETNGMGVIDTTWCYVRLSDISEDITDGDHQPPPKSENGIPFITISNIDSNNKVNFIKTFYVDESYYNKLKDNRKPQEGDILYTVTGSYGIPVLIDNNKEFCFQRHIALIRPYKAIKQKLLYYFLQSVYSKKQADEAATGTAQKTVSLKGLRNYILPLMPKEEQEIIVEEIEKRMSQCENIEKIINENLVKAEALKQSILKKAFEGKLVPQDTKDEQAEKLIAITNEN